MWNQLRLVNLLLCFGVFALPVHIHSTSAGVVPLLVQKDFQLEQQLCSKYKVVCEPGWQCQLGYLVFPAKEGACDSESEADCQSSSGMHSMEVFCTKQSHVVGLGYYKGSIYDDTPRLRVTNQRTRRGSCVELCNSNNDCEPGQFCVSNGCGHVCAKRPQ